MAGIADEDRATAFAPLGRVVSVGAETDDPQQVLWAGSAALFLGDGEQAGKLLARGASLARARGALGLLAPALAYLGLQRFTAQLYDQAALAATEAEQFAREVNADRPVLTEREHEILRLIADGKSAPAIGAELYLSTATVKTHLAHIYDKLGVSDRAAAVAEAMRRRLLE